MAKTVFLNIDELVTMKAASGKAGRRIVEQDLSIISDGAVVAENGKITWIGARKDLPSVSGDEVSLGGQTVLPAFLECHTHLAFAGDRSEEFEWRMRGMSYQEIATKGGGIVSTVKATRESSELLPLMQKRADRFVEQGITTLEIKSGYGLNEETELKSLRLAGQVVGPRIVRTFLGAHSKPPEFSSINEYFEYVLAVLLPKVAKEKLAERVDIFIEKGFFSAEQGSRLFAAAKSLGLRATAHVEQLSHSGGTSAGLASAIDSVDHLVEISDEEIEKLASSTTTAVLLPASDFYLRMKYPRARAMIDAGAIVALSTDYNPGTSPTQDLSFIGVLARLEMKMTLPEVLAAWTVGASTALGKQSVLGSLETGKSCDFSVLDGHVRELFYSVGHHPVSSVWKDGIKIKTNQKKF
jgi:imidazolonepropionase